MVLSCDTSTLSESVIANALHVKALACLGFIAGGLKFHIELICTGSHELYLLFHTEEVIV